jgi:hypothetical protein
MFEILKNFFNIYTFMSIIENPFLFFYFHCVYFILIDYKIHNKWVLVFYIFLLIVAGITSVSIIVFSDIPGFLI